MGLYLHALTPLSFLALPTPGPGVYVGCAYHIDARGRATKDDCMYFMLVRKF